MNRRPPVPDQAARRLLLLSALLAGALVAPAADILRSGRGAARGSDAAAHDAAAPATVIPAAAPAIVSAQDRLARTTQVLAAVQQMQQAARELAQGGANSLKPGLPAVPVNSFGVANGLVVASGVPADPTGTENAALWSGAALPTVTTQTNGGTTTSTVTVVQNQQQAVLNWTTFNIGKNTTLTFDQGLGGTNVGQWIAFNVIRDPTAAPTQILGRLKTIGAPDATGAEQVGGQVYVLNANGIIFGGSSQVNTHALVASSLPINYNLIQRGVLNNPDGQFMFTVLPQAAGNKGPTGAFDPAAASADGSVPAQTSYASDGHYGDVEVQAGAQLTAPTSADHVGGRIALVGPNVMNAGTISTADGQTILAAGLQVGFAAHNSSDATLRGLDVYVGRVADVSLPNQPDAGTATNAGLDTPNLGAAASSISTTASNPAGLKALGLIEAPRGDVYITGKTVNQSGVIDSSTSVAFNGRIDLVAAFNAVPNANYADINVDATLRSQPFVFQSYSDNDPVTGVVLSNSGPVTMGPNSVLQILPETASADRVVGDLALPSQVNIQGQAVYFAPNSTLLAPGAAVPNNKPAFGIDGAALGAGVAIRAGGWIYDNVGGNFLNYEFVHSEDAQQIYLDKSVVLDVGGMTEVAASVTENIIAVELRGPELANSPLQRDGPLRGQTIQVDVRQHGPWDPTLNGGLGGYTWVGTPLADTSGWIGLATHSVGELTVNGGSVLLQAGGAVVVQPDATINVSGGSINYQGGVTRTTRLTGADGHFYDIAKATPDRIYTGIYSGTSTSTDPKWGTTTTSTNPLVQQTYEAGYIQGGNGGSLSITAPVVALDGTLQGNTVAGKFQLTLSPTYKPASPPAPANPVVAGAPGWLLGVLNLPVPGQLSLAFQKQYFRADPSPVSTSYYKFSPTPPSIVFTSSSSLATTAPVEAFNPAGDYQFADRRKHELDLSPNLVSDGANGGGFGILQIDNTVDNASYDYLGASLVSTPGRGTIAVAQNTSLVLPAGGSLVLAAGNINIGVDSSIAVPGGSISLKAYDISTNTGQAYGQIGNVFVLPEPVYDPAAGNLTVDHGATLSVAGVVVDNRPLSPTPSIASTVANGGSINLAGNQVTLAGASVTGGTTLAASTLDVSGGAIVDGTGKFTYGTGGKIQLSAGKALGGGFGTLVGGTLALGADLRGYAGLGKAGGSIVIQAPSISLQNLSGGATVATDPAKGTLLLAPGFFDTGGFSAFDLTGMGVAVGPGGAMTGAAPALVVAGGVVVHPAVQSWLGLPGGPTYTAPVGLRQPAAMNLTASDVLSDILDQPLGNDTTLVMDANAAITTDALGSMTLKGDAIDLLGAITVPGGNVSITRTGVPPSAPYVPTVHFGPASVVDVSGATVFTADANGYHPVDVVAGGTIAVSGDIVAEGAGTVKNTKGTVVLDALGQAVQGKGAVFNVSGADGTVQLAPGELAAGMVNQSRLVSVEKQSNGGTLSFDATNELFVANDVKLLGGPGQAANGAPAKASGGDLVVQSRSTPVLPTDTVLELVPQAPLFLYAGLRQSVTDKTGQAYGLAGGPGLVWFGVGNFSQGQFGALTLSTFNGGTVRVSGGAVTIAASRQIAIANQGILTFAVGAVPSSLTLTAPYVALGTNFQAPFAGTAPNPFGANVVAPLSGDGVLTVHASTLIDVGNLSLQNSSVITLDATYSGQTGGSSGAIRGDGTLDVAGSITLKAGQVYPPTATTFNIIASDYSSQLDGTLVPGSVFFQPPGTAAQPALPLSAGGTLNVYASVINQGSVLRAPLGTINLGAAAGGGVDPLSGANLPVTSKLTLLPGSLTSVSAVDPATGQVTIPYGINVNGDTWIDPTGTDITGTGPVAKRITLVATSIDFQAAQAGQSAASIDLQGGGDLSAYRFVPGTSGTNDILSGSTAAGFAIVPGFTDVVTPYAPYATDSTAQVNLGADTGYVVGNARLGYHAGDRIHLAAGGGLPAGDYTLLPARYALLPGAYLVTPIAGAATAGSALSVLQPDGSAVVAGYRYNGLDSAGSSQDVFSNFSLAPQSVVLQRAQYDISTASSFFAGVAAANNTVAPRLPLDAGQLVLQAGTSLNLRGNVLAGTPAGGRGGLIDISSSADILIGSQSVIASKAADPANTTLLLDAAELSGFGAESLLIGGLRTPEDGDTLVNVISGNLKVDNAGEALTGTDIILVANKNLEVAAGADIHSSGTLAEPADKLRLEGSLQLQPAGGDGLDLAGGGGAVAFPNGTPAGDKLTVNAGYTLTHQDGSSTTVPTAGTLPVLSPGDTITLSGPGRITAGVLTGQTGKPIPVILSDGTLLRVSSDAAAQTIRSNPAGSTAPTLRVGAGATIAGAGVTVDSTNAAQLDLLAKISGKSLTFGSGQISVQLGGAGGLPPTTGLVLTGDVLAGFLTGTQTLSLQSYSTLDFYGSGRIGGQDSTGQPQLSSLALHAGAIRGYTNSSDPTVGVVLAAKAVTLDNRANGTAPAVTGVPAGSLTVDSDTLNLGGNQLEIQNYATVTLNATAGVLTGDPDKAGIKAGGLEVVGGDLAINTPLIAGAVASSESITAGGKLSLLSPGGTATVSPGLSARLDLAGQSVEIDTTVKLPSGSLMVEAATGDLNVAAGTLDVSGTAQSFYDVTKYTDGGRISLMADAGNLAIGTGSKVSVSAAPGGGSAGTVVVSAPSGRFAIAADTLIGQAGAQGQGGSFDLDALAIPGTDPAASHLATLNQALLDGGFTGSVDLRVRTGDVVVDGFAQAHRYTLSADRGSITVTGAIDASGLIGSSRTDPLAGTMNAADPTGGLIDLSASGKVVVASSGWLTAAGYAYDNAGKGGTISLSAGSYDGQVDTTASVDIQPGAVIDLGVKNRFTVEDMALSAGLTPPPSTRTDLAAGTLHLRESQVAFGTGAQFNALGASVVGASGIVLEGFQVFDLTGTNGATSTSGAVTSIGTGGLIDQRVENAVLANGTAFAAGLDPTLVGNTLFHVQPGAEIVNQAAPDATITRNFVTLNNSVSTARSVVNFGLKSGNGVSTTIAIPGGLPVGTTLRTTTARRFTLTYANGTTSSIVTATPATSISSTSATNPVVAVNFLNTGTTVLATQLTFFSGTTPVTLALDTATRINSSSFAGQYSSTTGDLVLANTWNLSSYRFGPRSEPGNLTLRARGNLILGFDASLNDGFDPANAVDARNPWWTAPLMAGNSWSYRLVAGADYGAADSHAVRPLGLLATGSGSVLLGLGGRALPTTTGNSVTSTAIIPQYYQVVRTGTGNIDISAGRDVQFLNPLAAVYTAGTKAAVMPGFDLPGLGATAYPASYSQGGGDVAIRAQNDIVRYLRDSTGVLQPASSLELPNNWLYRRGHLDANGNFSSLVVSNLFTTEVQSTTWWSDFSNFFDDVGALGGGNVTLAAGRNVSNVNASVPTNARMPGKDLAGNPLKPDATTLLELGGGDLLVQAAANIDGGVYYVERGVAAVQAGGAIGSNPTRFLLSAGNPAASPVQWLPTTFFLGKGSIDVVASGDILLGPVANTFLLPQSANNQDYERTFFSTYAPSDSVAVTSFGGRITLHNDTDGIGPVLDSWYLNLLGGTLTGAGRSQPWLRILDFGGDASVVNPFGEVAALMPGTFRATAFSNDITLVGSATLAPSPTGTLDLLTSGSIDGLAVNVVQGPNLSWGTAAINLSDASPDGLPGVVTPLSPDKYLVAGNNAIVFQLESLLSPVNEAISESGGTNLSLADKLAKHGHTVDAQGKLVTLHHADPDPVHLYAVGGDISGLTFYSGKTARVVAGNDITDIALYIQNNRLGDATLVAAGRDIIPYDPGTPLRIAAQQPGNVLNLTAGETGVAGANPTAGDIQIAGPGTLEVLAGRNLNLGSGNNPTTDGTAVGLTSVGSIRNSYLPQNSGSDIIALAGARQIYSPSLPGQPPGLATTGLTFAPFIAQFLDPASAGAMADRYLPVLGAMMGVATTDPAGIWSDFGFTSGQPLTERQAILVLGLFQRVIRDAARDRNDPASATFGKYTNGFAAIAALFPGSPEPTDADIKSTVPVVRPSGPWSGRISLPTRLIETLEGGNITLLAPGGDVTVGRSTDPQKPDQGVLTERGGGISIFAADSVNVGTSRIFTLRGGDETVWSTWGDIAAGSGSKTVFSAPPTRVIIDPQSGDVQNDLAGLATGSGIGVLATLAGVKPGDVDLIAPVGTVDAGDAGIRASGNLNVAARVVLNAANIQVGGVSVGTPPPPAPPNLGPLSAANVASTAAASAAADVAKQGGPAGPAVVLPSLVSVEVLGYGGSDEEDDRDARHANTGS